jgi:beta-lactamase regulating signal transducer with metallopeptidase domain
MEHLFNSVTISLFHSIWQAALLILLYISVTGIFKQIAPVAKRNLLFLLLAIQFFISLITFGFLFFDIPNTVLPAINHYSVSILTQPVNNDFINTLFIIYISVVSFKSFFLIGRWIQFRNNIYRNLVKAPVDIKLFTQIKSTHFGLKRKVSIWYSSVVSSPLTFGFFKPVILLPLSLVNGLTIEETESIIIHELTHIQKQDYLFNWLVLLMEIVFFFNPFIVSLCKKIKLEREKNCDVQVLQFDYDAGLYASTLLKIAKLHRSHQPFNLAAAHPKSSLLKRIEYFSEEKNLIFSKLNYKILPAVIILLVITFNALILPLNNKKITGKSEQPSLISLQSEVPVPFANAAFPQGTGEAVSKQHGSSVARESSPIFIKNNAIDESKVDDNDIYAVAAGNVSAPGKNEKEVIVKEENSGGHSITVTYTLVIENGEMIIKPLWSLSEIKGLKDSLKIKADTVLKAFNIVQ